MHDVSSLVARYWPRMGLQRPCLSAGSCRPSNAYGRLGRINRIKVRVRKDFSPTRAPRGVCGVLDGTRAAGLAGLPSALRFTRPMGGLD